MPYSTRLIRTALAIAAVATATPAARAAEPIHVEKVTAYRLKTPNGFRFRVDVELAKPPDKTTADPTSWRVETAPLDDPVPAFTTATNVTVLGVAPPPANRLDLAMDNPACDTCLVRVYFQNTLQSTTTVDADKPTPIYRAAKNKNDADIYFNWAIATSKDNKPNYSIDSAVGGSVDFGAFGQLGARAAFVVDKEPTLDPDSIMVGATWRKVVAVAPGSGVIFRTDLFRGEFDRDDQVRNGVVSILATVVTKRARIDNHTFIGVDPVLGFEFGGNFRTFDAAQDERIARLVLGGDLVYAIVRHGAGDLFTIDGAYRLRVLATNEPRTDPGSTAAVFDRSHRGYLSVDFTVNFTDYLGVAVSVRDGSLPPVYHVVQRKVGVGLTLKLKQRSRPLPIA